ncbi:NAD(P)-binding protein [Calocera cornea HHB12733]|uniref:NAD(P)-binding protein n=1 Tax=Calocera cornea HHB12733 TaxID=1353952 RepID=A0A165DP93_9BASI|nr:NAD(P)-binding protein [Calocera cornea HHB12733]
MASNQELTASALFDFRGAVAVVTGGGTGIGLMCAQALANNGAKVYIAGRRLSALDAAVKAHGSTLQNGGALVPVQADITDKASIAELVKQVSAREKQVDVLVNNAGIDGPTNNVEAGNEGAQQLHDELWQIEPKEWLDVYNTNVVGHFFTTVAFLPLLSAATARKPGYSAAVVNISSISGITRTTQHHFAYNVSKSAAIQLTTMLAQELSRPGVKVRVNSIAPGLFPTEMTTDESDEHQKSHMPAGDDFRENKGVPAGRAGRDQDMAQAVLMLAANQYANGQTVAIDGGYLLRHP